MISFERNGIWVKLYEFKKEEVAEYLENNLEDFKIIANSTYAQSMLVVIKECPFIIHTRATLIELSFFKDNVEDMLPVIQKITEWDKFSDTEPTFYVQIKKENSCSIIFENGYASVNSYKNRFGEDLVVTNF